MSQWIYQNPNTRQETSVAEGHSLVAHTLIDTHTHTETRSRCVAVTGSGRLWAHGCSAGLDSPVDGRADGRANGRSGPAGERTADEQAASRGWQVQPLGPTKQTTDARRSNNLGFSHPVAAAAPFRPPGRPSAAQGLSPSPSRSFFRRLARHHPSATHRPSPTAPSPSPSLSFRSGGHGVAEGWPWGGRGVSGGWWPEGGRRHAPSRRLRPASTRTRR